MDRTATESKWTPEQCRSIRRASRSGRGRTPGQRRVAMLLVALGRLIRSETGGPDDESVIADLLAMRGVNGWKP